MTGTSKDAAARIELRAYAPAQLLALMEGEDEFARCFEMPVAPGLREMMVSEVSAEFVAKLKTAEAADPWTFGFAVIDRSVPLVVGNVGYHGPPDDEGMTEIGYGIAPNWERQGIATEAARQLVEFAFRDPRVQVVRAHTRPETNASGRVLIKNGFTWTGSIVDPDDGLVWRWERTRAEPKSPTVNNVRVELPYHLRNLANVGAEVQLEVAGPVTQRTVLDALEAKYPALRGTIRDYGTLKRRPFLRYFACSRDLSLHSPDELLPEAVANGTEPFLVVGAIAGG